MPPINLFHKGTKMIQINHFIQVKGKENVGKTTIIDWCFLKLLENKQSTPTTQRAQLKFLEYLENGDFRAIIERNGKSIVFISAGDIKRVAEDNYKNALREMYQNKVDICVFATRRRCDSGSVEFWQDIATQNGKQDFDESLENCKIDVGEDGNKKEVTHYLQEQSKKLVNLIEKYL